MALYPHKNLSLRDKTWVSKTGFVLSFKYLGTESGDKIIYFLQKQHQIRTAKPPMTIDK